METVRDYSGQERLKCNVTATKFNGATLENSAFGGCALTNSQFNSAILSSIMFHRSVLDRVDFRNAKLSHVRFFGSALKHVDLRYVVGDFEFYDSIGLHVRVDFESAKRVKNWPERFADFKCVSSIQANQCWDLVSQDLSECRDLAPAKTYVSVDEAELQDCIAWTKSVARK